jgi:hypothetical protein
MKKCLTLFQSYCYKLFVVAKTPNSFAIKQIQTLLRNTRGMGTQKGGHRTYFSARETGGLLRRILIYIRFLRDDPETGLVAAFPLRENIRPGASLRCQM